MTGIEARRIKQCGTQHYAELWIPRNVEIQGSYGHAELNGVEQSIILIEEGGLAARGVGGDPGGPRTISEPSLYY